MERTDRTEKNNEKWFKGAAFEGAMDPELPASPEDFSAGMCWAGDASQTGRGPWSR